jgi:hypothetical protein
MRSGDRTSIPEHLIRIRTDTRSSCRSHGADDGDAGEESAFEWSQVGASIDGLVDDAVAEHHEQLFSPFGCWIRR